MKRQITLDQNTSGWTETDSAAQVMTTIAEYTVPVGSALVFRPNDTVSLYLEDNETTAAELDGSCPVEIVIEKPYGIGSDLLVNGQYTKFKEFQDQTKFARINQTMVARANSVIKIRANPNYSTIDTIDASDCRYALTALLVLD
uniref:Uncharacterized protein n=1 Tax=viral metagenome TaxID=1070528 RepID=A0A6M3IQI5_9ZZZZ